MSLNINISKVDERVVDKYLTQFAINVKGKLNAKVNALETFQQSHTPESDQSTPCTECGGVSDVNLPECPFCGTADTDIPTKTNGVAVSEPAEVEAKVESEPESHNDSQADAATVEAEPVKKKKQKLVESKANKPKPNGKAHAGIIVDTPATSTELTAAKDLDDAIVRVVTALRAGATSYWDLGTALLDIFDKQLWKQRIEGGRQKYPSWNLFCRDELGMSHVNTFSIMDAARAATREDFEAIGHKKIQLLLRLPKERAQELLEEAKKGRLSRAKLKQIIQDEGPKEQRDTGRSTKTKKATEAAAEKKREARKLPAPDGEITAVSQLGRTKIKLYARPPKKGGGKPSRAVSLSQDPWGEETLVNGVTVRYTVVKTSSGVELVIERRRAE